MFFLSNVPISQYKSDKFVSEFPFLNRDMEIQTRDDLKQQISKVGKNGWTFKMVTVFPP